MQFCYISNRKTMIRNKLIFKSFQILHANCVSFVFNNFNAASLYTASFPTCISSKVPIMWIYRRADGTCVSQWTLQYFELVEVTKEKIPHKWQNFILLSSYIRRSDDVLIDTAHYNTWNLNWTASWWKI